ncbi:hypothetical protein F5Y18DRAFT_438885 [Xylariaceae sp. FL1019]|nr:hypothetical protein F5Y18DRAFT_438885 [Xylariaceae sp. FL1019]
MQLANINLGDKRWWGVSNAAAALAQLALMIIGFALILSEIFASRSKYPRHAGSSLVVPVLGIFSFSARIAVYDFLNQKGELSKNIVMDDFTRKTVFVFSSVICSGLLLAEVTFATVIVTYSKAIDVVCFLVTMVAALFLGVSVAADILSFRTLARQGALADEYTLASQADTELTDAPPYSEHEQARPQKEFSGIRLR